MTGAAAPEASPRRFFSGLVVGEDHRGDLPSVRRLDQVQAELAAALLPLVDEDEIGADTGDLPARIDADVLQSLADRPARLEVILLRLEELVEPPRLDPAAFLRVGNDQGRMEQQPPAVESGPGVETDIVGDGLVERGPRVPRPQGARGGGSGGEADPRSRDESAREQGHGGCRAWEG